MHIGISGHGTYIPRTFMTAADIAVPTGVPEEVVALKFGVKRKPVAGPDETTSMMGLEAAKKALASAGVAGNSLDLVIWCGAQHKDYPCWLAGLYVAEQLGAKNSWGFDMEAMCGSMMVALDVAKSMMLTRDDLNTVLLVSGYRNNDLIDLTEPSTRFLLDLGSGGSALVLQKNAGKNAVLGSSFRGDGSFSQLCTVPVLGTRAWPPQPGDLARAHFMVPDEEAFKKLLTERTMPNFFGVIRDALKRSAMTQADIDYLAILHFKKSAHDAVLAELGLKAEQSTYLDEYGHLGQNDQVLSLELGLASGKIHDGSRLVFVGAGLGFVWAATVIQWGPYHETIQGVQA